MPTESGCLFRKYLDYALGEGENETQDGLGRCIYIYMQERETDPPRPIVASHTP